jgi:Pentapeptide repeats (8 copies)
MNGEGETGSPTSNEAFWKRREYLVQLGATIGSLAAALVAVFVAVNAFQQTKATQEGVRRAADESRLATAVNSIGADLPAQRVAGFTFLRRHAAQRVESANEGGTKESDRRDALRLFRGTLDILATYLNDPTPSSPSEPEPQPTSEPPKPPTGIPDESRDYVYAAGELRALLQQKAEFLELRTRVNAGVLSSSPSIHVLGTNASHNAAGRDEPLPTIDLSNTTLYGLPWAGVDFSWLEGPFLERADLRYATLIQSNWKAADLKEAFMQCAVLGGANFKGANLRFAHLEHADLHGAHLEDADLTGAHLEHATLSGAHLQGADLKGAHLAGATVEGLRGPSVGVMSPAVFYRLRNFGDDARGVPRQAASEDKEQLECDGLPAPA